MWHLCRILEHILSSFLSMLLTVVYDRNSAVCFWLLIHLLIFLIVVGWCFGLQQNSLIFSIMSLVTIYLFLQLLHCLILQSFLTPLLYFEIHSQTNSLLVFVIMAIDFTEYLFNFHSNIMRELILEKSINFSEFNELLLFGSYSSSFSNTVKLYYQKEAYWQSDIFHRSSNPLIPIEIISTYIHYFYMLHLLYQQID